MKSCYVQSAEQYIETLVSWHRLLIYTDFRPRVNMTVLCDSNLT